MTLNLGICPEEIDKEVDRLMNIKLKRHKSIKQSNAELIAKKIVKTSFIIEEFLKLSADEKKTFLRKKNIFSKKMRII